MSRLTARPAASVTNRNPARSLRIAGWAALVALAGMLITPIIVISGNLANPDVYNPLTFHDPVTWMNSLWQALIYGLSAPLIAVALVVMMVNVRAVIPVGRWSDAAFLLGAVPVVGWLTFGGSTAASYSTFVIGDITATSADPAVRSMVGYASTLDTQGVLGGASIALCAWLIAVSRASRSQRIFGRLFLACAGILTVAILALYCVGGGGATNVVVMPLMLLIGCTLLIRAHRTPIAESADGVSDSAGFVTVRP